MGSRSRIFGSARGMARALSPLLLAATVGVHSVTFAVDPRRQDTPAIEPGPARPDLVPFNMTIALCAPTIPCRNCPPVTTHVGVKNQGRASANGPVIVQLFGPANPGLPLHSKTVNGVPVGGTVRIGAFTHPRECPGDAPATAARYRINVDVKNAVAESNEQNNSAVWVLKGTFTPQ